MLNKIFFYLCVLFGVILLINSYQLNITDRISYVQSIEFFPSFLGNRIVTKGFIFTIFNDPLWVMIMGIGYFSGLDAEIYIIVICSISYMVTMKSIYKSLAVGDFYKFIPILLSATFLINFMTHIRQGIALSLLSYSLYIGLIPRIKKPILFWLSPLIHNSFFLVTFYFFVENFIKKNGRISKVRSFSILVITTTFISLIISFGRQNYLNNLTVNSNIGFGLFYWLAIFLLVIFGNLQKSKLGLSKELLFILFYMIIYFVSPLIAGRLMEVFLIFIFIWLNSKFSSKFFFLLTLSYFTLSWVSRYTSNYYGFGA
jgi:hypothetical protein